MFKITYYYLLRNKCTTILMVLALTITFYFPLLSNTLSRVLYAQMMQRAEATPLIVAAQGSRFITVLNTIYFRTETLDPIPIGIYHEMREQNNIQAIPIYNMFQAKVPIQGNFESIPIIATTHDYLRFRGLETKTGSTFLFPGEIVIGHDLAKQANLQVGDTLLSEISSLINLNTQFPLSLEVVGILEPTGTEDDHMIFSDLKTGWIMAGYFHGHESPQDLGDDYILSEEPDVTQMRQNVITYTEVNQDNLASFHFHGDPDELPLTAVIVIPQDERAKVITAGRYNAQDRYGAYRPNTVMQEFFGIVFAVNRIFNSYFILVMTAVVCFISIIVLFSARLRKDEFQTIKTLGGSRFMVMKLYLCEYSILLLSALLLAGLLTWQTLSIFKNLYI